MRFQWAAIIGLWASIVVSASAQSLTWLGTLGGARSDGYSVSADGNLLNVLFAFGTAGVAPTRHEDINKDGIVDDADLLMVLLEYDSHGGD